MTLFARSAPDLWKSGFSPLPIVPKEKRPAFTKWQEFCKRQPTEAELSTWIKKYPDHNVGVALGLPAGNEQFRMVAIDVDDGEMMERVELALPKPGPAKKGKKGITYFCKAPAAQQNKKLLRKIDGQVLHKPSVEILAFGSQTVIPPSIHPDGMQYRWIGATIDEVAPADWPLADQWVIDEITLHCQGSGKHFDALNSMTWLGVGGGGNTHDVCLAAVAFMVARQWSNGAITARIHRAKKRACEIAGDTYNWPEADRVIAEWIQSARDHGMAGNAVAKVPMERLLASWVIGTMGGSEVVATLQGQLRRYNAGHWEAVNVIALRKSILDAHASATRRQVEDAVRLVETQQHRAVEEAARKICLVNGTLDPRTGRLERHDPDDWLLHQLNIEWDESAACPLYARVVERTFDSDTKSIAAWDEFCGLTLIDEMKMQKAIFLLGPGKTGKSTLANTLISMHAPGAVSAVPITSLDKDYNRAHLVGRLLNIASEQTRLSMINDDVFKAITGGDPIQVRPLYRDPFMVRLTVRFLQVTNELPSTADASDALRRRLLILSCPNPVAKPDTSLHMKLMNELPGILRRWVEALHRLLERGRFDDPAKSEKIVADYIAENDPVRMWVEECCESSEKGTMSTELWAHFRHWADNMGFRPVNAVFWGKRLTYLGYESKTTRRGEAIFRGRSLRIKPGYDTPI